MIETKDDLLFELTEQIKKAKTEMCCFRIEVNDRIEKAIETAKEIMKSENEELAQLVRDMRTWMKNTGIQGKEYTELMERAEDLVDHFFETEEYLESKEVA